MNTWFECKVRYVKVDENGKEKKTTEPYLVDAVSFSDAESRMNYLMEQYIHGEFSIRDIKQTPFTDVVNSDDAQLWFKCKVTYSDVDEKTEKVKQVTNWVLIAANDVPDAHERVQEAFKDMLVQFEIPSIQESPIVDVFPYFEMGEDDPNVECYIEDSKEQINETIDRVIEGLKDDKDQLQDDEYNVMKVAAKEIKKYHGIT
jgi:hypothetical protein